MNNLSHQANLRALQAFDMSDNTALTPRAFFDQLFPIMARIYVEVSDEHKELGIVMRDKRVWEALIRVLGFDPSGDRYQYAVELNVQVWALRRAKEAEHALYIADEIEQLDGQPALDFALGWMMALDFFEGMITCTEKKNDGQCSRSRCPSRELAETTMKRAAGVAKPFDAGCFEKGYLKCVEMKTDPSVCILSSKIED